MKHIIPRGLANVLQAQWSCQRRFPQRRASCCAEPLRTFPQGNPMTPLALNLLMWAGLRFQRTCPSPPGARQRVIYMDDRAWTTNSQHLLLQALDAWRQFSNAVGLKENVFKTQLFFYTCGTACPTTDLFTHRPDLRQAVTPSACVLGSCKGRS